MKRVKKKQQDSDNKLSIGYTGNVTIKVVRNNKVVKTIQDHNEGTIHLFEFIAKCLSGVYEEQFGPKYLVLYNTEDSPATRLTDAVLLTSSTYVVNDVSDDNSDVATAQLTFTVPGNIFLSSEKQPTTLALYSYNGKIAGIDFEDKHYLARLNLTSNLGVITSDTNLIIVWELNIGNISNN